MLAYPWFILLSNSFLWGWNLYPNLSTPQFEPWAISLYNETEKETQRIYFTLALQKETKKKKQTKKRFMLLNCVFWWWENVERQEKSCAYFVHNNECSLFSWRSFYCERTVSIVWITQNDCSEEFTVMVSTELDKIGKGERWGLSGSSFLNLAPANAVSFFL